MDAKRLKRVSKLMSLVLRHNPSKLGIEVDKNGWTDLKILMSRMNDKGLEVTMETIEYVVENNNKKRFSFNSDKSKIRANQGHSIDVDVELEEVKPPHNLYHGTVDKFLGDIMDSGLKKMNRLHVHLSEDLETATNVGSRRGKPVILEIASNKMFFDGYKFYKSVNGVWLTDCVPVEYIKLL